MASLSTINPTLLDVGRSLDPNGKVAKIVDIIQQYNDILDDIPWMEGNLPTGHQITQQATHATPTFRLLNAGVVPTKSTTGQIVEACAILENRNQIDINVAKLNGNTAAFRMSQDRPMIAGFGDTLASTLITGDVSVNPERFNGLQSRFFTLGSTYTTYTQLIDGGGTGSDNSSIWLVNWGADKVFGIYPKGSMAGLQHEDLGIQEVVTNTSTGATMRAYVSWMQWMCGLAVADYRNVIRICNIDISNLLTASDSSDSSANILKFMSKAMDLLPPGSGGKPVFYMNNTVRSMLRVKLMDKSNFCLSLNDVMGPGGIARKELHFFGIPCRRVDAITSTEARITAGTT